jgi:uroporphyrinogen decarboxylase
LGKTTCAAKSGLLVAAQADAGAQAVQIFDSWAAHLAPRDFDVFAGPYIKQIVDSVKATHPDLPLILYISGSGGLLERMAATGVDIISVDGSVDMPQAIQRCGRHLAYQVGISYPPARHFGWRCIRKGDLSLAGAAMA